MIISRITKILICFEDKSSCRTQKTSFSPVDQTNSERITNEKSWGSDILEIQATNCTKKASKCESYVFVFLLFNNHLPIFFIPVLVQIRYVSFVCHLLYSFMQRLRLQNLKGRNPLMMHHHLDLKKFRN